MCGFQSKPKSLFRVTSSIILNAWVRKWGSCGASTVPSIYLDQFRDSSVDYSWIDPVNTMISIQQGGRANCQVLLLLSNNQILKELLPRTFLL
jgi:hypothetical protein